MSALKELIKVDLKETFDKRKFKENKKAQTFLAFAIVFGILFLGLSTLYNFIYVGLFRMYEVSVYVPVIFLVHFHQF